MTKQLFLLIGILFFTNILFASIPPQIFNFRIEADQDRRVYFDSDKPISGNSFKGFTVSNRSITGITINEGEQSNHYVTVSRKFTYWDNNTIRYEGGSDLQDEDENGLIEFTLSYIINNIPEPEANEARYVTTSAKGGGDGKSENSAWTLEEAFDKAYAGITVWIKAGNYGNQNLSIYNDGTSVRPLKFIGYKKTPGDITKNYYDYGKKWSTSEMPTLTGKSASDGHAIQLRGVNYVVFRNLQITNYYKGIRANGTLNSNLVFDKLNGKTFGLNNNTHDDINGSFIGLETYVSGSGYRPFKSNNNMKILNSVSLNASMLGFRIFGEGGNLIDNCKSYSDRTGTIEKLDYHIDVNGHNNIIRNCHVENFNSTRSNMSTHGIGIRGSSNLNNTYNLIEKSTAINNKEGFYIRNYGCEYNVIKDCYVGSNGASGYDYPGGVYIWGGSNYNVIERMVIEDVVVGIGFVDNQEEGNTKDTSIGHDNIIRNSIIRNTKYSIYSKGSKNSLLKNNKIINCTFDNSDYFLLAFRTNIKNLEIINSHITNVKKSVRTNGDSKDLSGINFKNSNFWKSWGVLKGSNFNINPNYINPKNLQLTSKTAKEIREGGLVVPEVQLDIEKKVRKNYNSIGAYQYKEKTTSFNRVEIGKDVEICFGDSTTLIASGEGSFLWNTGERTKNIVVSPKETQTYKVTLTDGENISTDEVVVSVSPDVYVNLSTTDSKDVCKGSAVTLTAESNVDVLWSTGETAKSIMVNPSETTTYTVTAGNGLCSKKEEITITVLKNASVSLGSDISICYGEEVSLTAEGSGNFLWNTGETSATLIVSPLVTTSYSVSATSPCGVTVTDEIVVNVNKQLFVDAGENKSICVGESITLSADGNGDFLWSTGATTKSITVSPKKPESYWVSVSSQECSISDEVFVDVKKAADVNLGDDLTICSGEVVTLNANGHGDFIWNTGDITSSISVSPIRTTTYAVTATSNACTADAKDEITIYVNESVNANAGNDVTIEPEESVTLTATGGSSYLWSTGETTASILVQPNKTTVYTVEVGNGTICGGTDDVKVTVQEIPLTINDGNNITLCKGEELILQAQGSSNYFWSNGLSDAKIMVSPNVTTTYTVSAQKNGILETASVIVTVEDCSANRAISFDVYPNPTSDILNINIPLYKESVELILSAIDGEIVLVKEVKADNNGIYARLDLSHLSDGVYFIKIINENFNQIKKIIISNRLI